MKTVNVEKNKLLEKLRENRTKHTDEYAVAWDDYKSLMLAEFENMRKKAEKAKLGEVIPSYASVPVPEDNTSEYDRAISVLEWEISDEIELTQQEFAQYVLDDWGWKGKFKETSTYLAANNGPHR